MKPTEIDDLVTTNQAKLDNRKTPRLSFEPKSLAELAEANHDWILKQWLRAVKDDPVLAAVSLSQRKRKDHVPRLLDQAAARIRDQANSNLNSNSSELHGRARFAQGYTLLMIVREARILQRVLSDLFGRNLLAIEISHLVGEMSQMNDTVAAEPEGSCGAFERERKSRSRKSKR